MRMAPGRMTALLTLCMGTAGIIAACGSTGSGGSTFPGDGGDGSMHGKDGSSSGSDGISLTDHGASGDSSGSSGASIDADFPCDGCSPFPPEGAPTCGKTTLGAPGLVYPPDGILVPPNMNVMEVQWTQPTTGTAAMYEVDFTNSVTNVRIETPCLAITSVRGTPNVGCGFTLTQKEWNDLANTNRDGDPVKITVRATPASEKCVTSSPQKVEINFAKEDLTGGIYYWQSATYGGIAGTTGGIYFHDFGTFDPTPTPFWTSGSTGTCIGCHTLSKDGFNMEVLYDDPDADDEYGDVRTLTLDVASRSALNTNTLGPGFVSFTHDHKYMVATDYKAPMGVMLTGLDTAFSVWTGDGKSVFASTKLPTGMQGTQPNLSSDDKTLVFVAPTYGTIDKAGDGHFLGASLWQAAFDESSGAITGFKALLSATGKQSFYYPDQSPDGSWVVFNENDDNSAANNNGDAFYNRQSVVKLLHFPAKTGDVPISVDKLNIKAGLSNSWPRWSPAVQTYKGHKILWVTFSSNRDYGLRLKNEGSLGACGAGGTCTTGTCQTSTNTCIFDNYYPPESPTYDQPQPASKMGITFDNYAAPQIWMAAIVVDSTRSLDKTDRSYPAFWLPFQDVTAHNHSAQWVDKVEGGGPGGDGGVGDGGGGDGSGGKDGGHCGGLGASCSSGNLCCAAYLCQGGVCTEFVP